MIKSELKFLDLVGWRWICMTFLLSCNVYWTLKLTYVGPRCLNKLLSVKLTCKKQRRVQICPIILRELLRLSSLFPRSVFWSWCAEGSFSTFSFPHSPAHLRSVGWCRRGRGRGEESGKREGKRGLKNEFGKFPLVMMFLLQRHNLFVGFQTLYVHFKTIFWNDFKQALLNLWSSVIKLKLFLYLQAK